MRFRQGFRVEKEAPSEEILDVQWFTYAEIASLKKSAKLRVEWIFDAITRVEKNQASS